MMKLSKFGIIAATLCLSSLSVLADIAGLPLTVRDGQTVHYYEVQPKETIYSLSNKLGITRDYLIETNPEVKDGLKAYMTLFFPIDADEAGGRTLTHTVKKGETIYGLSKQMGVTTDMLIMQNPQVADGLRPGQVLTVKIVPSESVVAAAKHTLQTSNNTQPEQPRSHQSTPDEIENGYIVREGETFYSIAHTHGITLSQLEDANPHISILKAGDRLNIPSETHFRPTDDTTSVAAIQKTEPESGSETETIAPADSDTHFTSPQRNEVAIAVMLPFMLSQKSPDKSAQRMTEFYKGFLMAIDSLKRPGTPVKIYAYDTAASSDTVKAILQRPELKKVEAIVAPDNEQQLAAIAAWGRDNNVMVFNSFVVKDDNYIENPSLMQANIPHATMSRKAIDALAERYQDHTPVILRRTEGPVDKGDFVAEMTTRLDRNGKNYHDLTYTDKLKSTDLDKLLPGNYIFVPVSGRQAELNKILPAITEFAESTASSDAVILVGYPEWISFRGETLSQMQQVNTVVYTRFFYDANDIESKRVEASFASRYGSQMASGLPRQGALGFDTGAYMLKALDANGGDFTAPTPAYNGVQSGYDFFKTSPKGGYVNETCYLINYRPGGLIEKHIMK